MPENMMSACMKCRFREQLQHTHHSACSFPGSLKLEAAILFMSGNIGGAVVANQHGVDNGWFNWPMNFDPVWLEKCSFYEEKENAEHTSGS